MNELRLRRARKEARDLLRTVGAEGEVPVPVEDIAHALGVELVCGELQNALASLIRAGERARIRIAEHHDHPGQLRFSIAHELGHYVLRHRSTLDLCDQQHIDKYFNDKQVEAEANAFASELLLPETHVRRRCEVSPADLDVVRGIAEDFGASPVATAIRFAELTSERCAVVLSQQRTVRWAVRSQSFWPTIKRGQRLIPWSLADGYFASGKLPTGREPIDASAWVDGRSLNGEVEIFEHAMALPQLRAVLSLVWIPESCGPLAHRAA